MYRGSMILQGNLGLTRILTMHRQRCLFFIYDGRAPPTHRGGNEQVCRSNVYMYSHDGKCSKSGNIFPETLPWGSFQGSL